MKRWSLIGLIVLASGCVSGCVSISEESTEPRIRVQLPPGTGETDLGSGPFQTVDEKNFPNPGNRWAGQPAPDGATLRAVWAVDGQHAYAVGEKGLVVKTEDNGETWTKVTPPADDTLMDVHFLDPRWGWVLGVRAAYRTEDGGATWQTVPATARLTNTERALLEEHTGGALARQFLRFSSYQSGLICLQGHLFATEDGGATWAEEPLPGFGPAGRPPLAKSVSFRDIAARGDSWVLSCEPLGLVEKRDGLWQRLGEEILLAQSVSFPTAEVGFAAVRATLHVTRDGGATWTRQMTNHRSLEANVKKPQQAGDLPAAATLLMVSPDEGWAAIGAIGHTVDGGKTWLWGRAEGDPGTRGMLFDGRTAFLIKTDQSKIHRLLP